MPEGTQISAMFGGIACEYDSANRVLSFGLDGGWRKKLVKAAYAQNPRHITDLATGSGDVAFNLAKEGQGKTPILGLDFCHPMLEQAKGKQKGLPEYAKVVKFAFGDCMQLPMEDNSTDAITIAFGFRNFEDRAQGLREMKRVLRPGGRLCILEFSQPYTWVKPFYYAYLKYLLPAIARIVTGNRDAYQYLVGSIESFPTREDLKSEIESAGFTEVQAHPLALGAVALHIGHV